MQNRKYKEFSAGRAGNGKVNLATGELTFVHEDMVSDANVLPINISHVYSSKRASDTTNLDTTYGKGFRLNLQQTLKKSNPDDKNDTIYVYTDASGMEHAFENRYYYFIGSYRQYISTLSDITIGADGKLTYLHGDEVYDVYTQLITESGLTLQTELKAFEGSNKLETRHEDIVQLTEEISQFEKSIADLEYNLVQYNKIDSKKYLEILNLQKNIEKESIAIEKDSLINTDTLYERKQTLNANKETLRTKNDIYTEETQQKRYEYLAGFVKAEIEKYKNMKENKQDILNKLNVQIPVNFIIDKDNLTMGFNADGNLVNLFDSYDNQVAIIYENGVISKVVDAENREIVFEYENKKSPRGSLISITDFKGHKTNFVYSGSCLSEIEYPNGETTDFMYTPEEFLSEMISPSKIGIQVQYNTDNKIISISELTTLKSINKNGVSSCQETTKIIADINYEAQTTFVSDYKQYVEEYKFNEEGKLCNLKTRQNGKLINVSEYEENEGCCRLLIVSENNPDNLIDKTINEDDYVTLQGLTNETYEWKANLDNFDISSIYFLCASARADNNEITPLRKTNVFCNKHNNNDTNNTYRRFEYKVLVNYGTPKTYNQSITYAPIATGDTINTLYLDDTFTKLPNKRVSSFFGDYISSSLTNYYPILGNGKFSTANRSKQVYYTAKDYQDGGLIIYGCALWAGNTLLWCNQKYKEEEGGAGGWQCDKVDLSDWGPITVHHSDKIHNWGQFLSKQERVFHNGDETSPNYEKDNQDPNIDEFIAGFDYTIKDRQYIALPITIRTENGKSKKPNSISVIAQYKQSQGESEFERPMLINGKVLCEYLDEGGNTVQAISDGEKIAVNASTGEIGTLSLNVKTDYNDENLPTVKRTINTYATEKGISNIIEVEKWFYNPQGSVIEYWNYVEGEELTSGVNITETVYDERGNAVKSFSYNSLDASTKFYNEQELADNGRVLADIDETGIYKTCYEYDDVIGKIKTETLPNGGRFSYAHDTNTDEVIAITHSTGEGEENSTNRVYTAGFLTELSSGANIVNFEYEKKGRQSAIKLNDKTYTEFKYIDDSENDTTTVTTTLTSNSSSSYTVEAISDKDGNLLSVKEGKESELLTESIVNTYYTEEDEYLKGLLKTSEDKIVDVKTEFVYNSLRQPLSTKVRDSRTNALISSETAEYDEYGQISKHKLVSGAYTQEYGYRYKNNFERELESIAMPYGLESTQQTDVNGRLKERELRVNDAPLSREYYYFRKHGDHGTNQISSVRYGERKNGQLVVKDGVSYTYDECGNISEIKENGKLSARYDYDKLNRLIREDNVQLGTTTLFIYDNNGNILSKRETAFTLRDTEKITEFADEKDYVYDAAHPDRLLSYGNEEISEYDAIGNPSIFRGNTLIWQKGRQLVTLKNENYTSVFTYDAKGRRTGKVSEGVYTKFFFAGDILIGEESDDESNTQYFGEDLSCVDADGFISGVIRGYTLEYFYGQAGVAGLVHNGNKYYFRRNVQGDITRIYSLDGTLAACYTYDAWGNHKVYDAKGNENSDPNFVGNINPFRYRGYYYDAETRLYYCGSRYYDPEVGRWINADDISYIDPETINGLNLYAYCLNNPVMMVDENGNKPKWWQWLLFGIGAALVVAAAVVLTVASGGAATGLIGAVVVGAAKGALIGAAVGTAVGIAGGAIYSSATGADMGQSILSGFLMGFGIGAIAGAVIGGIGGANGWYKAKALEFTNFGSKEVVLGRSPQYVEIAQQKGATYFHTSAENWNLVKNMKGVGDKGMWRINKAFLKQQIKSGAIFNLTAPSGGYFYAKEFAYIIKHALFFF